MTPKIRLKLLKKIAQTNPPTTSEQTTVVAGQPTAVSIDSFPSARLAWGSAVGYIQNLINTINIAIHTLTNGRTDFAKLKQQNFSVDASAYVGPTKGIVSLASIVYQTMLTNRGVDFKAALTPEQKSKIIADIKQSTTLGSIPDGGINSILPTKIGGNLKSIIVNLLNNIR